MYLRAEQKLLREGHNMQSEQNSKIAQFLKVHIVINQQKTNECT